MVAPREIQEGGAAGEGPVAGDESRLAVEFGGFERTDSEQKRYVVM